MNAVQLNNQKSIIERSPGEPINSEIQKQFKQEISKNYKTLRTT